MTATPPVESPKPDSVQHGSWRQEIRATTRLAFPVVISQLGMMAMGVVDLAMVGRLSETEIAAAALGHVFAFAVCIFALGTLQALDPLIAQAFGANDLQAVRLQLQRGVILATLLGIPVSLLALLAEPTFRWLEEPEAAIPLATSYVHALIPGLFPFLWFATLHRALQALSITRTLVITVIVANAANAVLDWALIWGHLGLPALGAIGSAWATSICRLLLVSLLLLTSWRHLGRYLQPWQRASWNPRELGRMLRLGMPIGGAQLAEYGAFFAVALLMGRISTLAVASHQFAINLASITFMVPLGISGAAAVRVGYAVGRQDPIGARRAAACALVAGAGVMACFALLFLTCPTTFARFYTNQPEVLAMTALLIPIAGVFQVFDGVQVVASGVLRGLGDTRTPFLVQLVGFWILGVPLGCLLTFAGDHGPQGLWWGLVLGLATVAVVLLLVVIRRQRASVRRLPM